MSNVPCVALLLPVLLCACASGPRMPLAPDESARLREARVDVVVLDPHKRVTLSEFLYKVLWNEEKVRQYSIDGIWDPAPRLESALVHALRTRCGLKAAPLREKLEPPAYTRFESAAVESFHRRTREEGSPYLQTRVEEPVRTLQAAGADYLLEVDLMGLVVWHHSWGINRLYVLAIGRLIRISDGEVVWMEQWTGNILIRGMSSFADLEKNDLALLKKTFESAAAQLCDSSDRFLREFEPR